VRDQALRKIVQMQITMKNVKKRMKRKRKCRKTRE